MMGRTCLIFLTLCNQNISSLYSSLFSFFFVTVLFVVKRWIGFSLAFLFLLVALAVGIILNYQGELNQFPTSPASLISPSNVSTKETMQIETFETHMKQAFEDLKNEVKSEKENLRTVMNEVQEIFDSLDVQKHKLEHFIEEVREQFKKEPSKNTISEHSKN